MTIEQNSDYLRLCLLKNNENSGFLPQNLIC